MITHIDITGFKSITQLELALGQVNCFIGANGVGKTNLLEAIGVLSAAAKGRIDDESLLHRGVRPALPQLYKSAFKSERRTATSIRLSASNQQHASYQVTLLNTIKNPAPAWQYQTEQLTDGNTAIVPTDNRQQKNINAESGLAALKLVEMPTDNAAFQLMTQLQNYAIYSPNTPTMRGMVGDPKPRNPVGLSGGRLAEGFAEIKEAYLAQDEALQDSLFDLIDWVDRIDVAVNASELLSPSVARTQYLLKLTDRFMKKGRNTLTAYDASEGILYILFCAILCLSPNAPQLLAIDNLDQALNPRLAAQLTRQLLTWLSYQGKQRQLLFTTHNPAVLDGLDLDNDAIRLFAVDRNNKGHTTVSRIVLTDGLRELLHQYPLSRLWLMGHLGAVPNV